jgi:Mrp family chromosome partitioning ATPase
VSRLLDALRNLQQSHDGGDDAPPRKITPRLAASIRKAVLGGEADNADIPPADAPVLFHLPDASEPTPVEAEIRCVPDPVQLVESIQASICEVQAESTESEVAYCPEADALRQDEPADVTIDAPQSDDHVEEAPLVEATLLQAAEETVHVSVPAPISADELAHQKPEVTVAVEDLSTTAATSSIVPQAVSEQLSASIDLFHSYEAIGATEFTDPDVADTIQPPSEVVPVVAAEPARTPEEKNSLPPVAASLPGASPWQSLMLLQPAKSHDVAPVEQSTPTRSRPAPTAGELELAAVLANEEMGQQFRELLAAVQRDVTGITLPIVAIVGLEERDATERVAAALGTLWSAAGNRTLLIEANSRRELARRYGLSHSQGLREALSSRRQPRDAIVTTSGERLDFLLLGSATGAPDITWTPALLADACGSPSRYDSLVLDLGSLSSPWAIELSRLASAVYLVVSLGDASAELATASVERFRAAGGQLKGCIAVDRE